MSMMTLMLVIRLAEALNGRVRLHIHYYINTATFGKCENIIA